MSSALAIASVTHVLKDVLNDGLINHDVTNTVNGSVTVSSLPPDRIDIESEDSRLNLYMYMATPNQGWKNNDYPSHNGRGDRISNPPLALDLHYMLTAYGSDELHHDILLGYGMQLLHETPVLPRDAVRRSLAPPVNVLDSGGGLSNELRALSTSELAEQIELIKITPENLTTEEVSRLWTAFGAKFRPNAAYKATVVLIESRLPAKSALPVRRRNIYVRPFNRPVIEKLRSQAGAGQPEIANQKILFGYNLILDGFQLRGELTTVNVGGFEVDAANMSLLSDKQITFPIPANVPAGIHGVQVVHELLMGSPPLPHRGVSSNVEAFVLSPTITGAVNATTVSGSGDDLRAVNVTLNVQPAILETQRLVLLLNEITSPASDLPAAYSFEFPASTLSSPPGPVQNFTVRIDGVNAGDYLVRVRVDGAESPLGFTAGIGYNTPNVTIT